MSPKTRRFFLLVAFGLTTAGFWAYHLFPSDAIRRALESRMRFADTEIRIGRIAPDIQLNTLPGIRASDIRLRIPASSPVSLAEIRIRPGKISLTGGTVTWILKIEDPQAKIDGEWSVSSGWFGHPEYIRLFGQQVRLEGFPILQEKLNRPIQGVLTWEMESHFHENNFSGNLLFTVTDAGVGVNIPELALEMIHFQRIEARLEFTDGLVRVTGCDFTGPHLTGHVVGDIRPAGKPEDIQILLKGTARLHHPLMAGFRYPSILTKMNERFSEGIPFQISGSPTRIRWTVSPATPPTDGNRP